MKHSIAALTLAAILSTAAGCATAGPSTTSSTSRTNPDVISTAEIDAAPNIRDAYDLVQRLRPSWLNKGRASGGRLSTASMAGLVVYLDNARLGGLEALSAIPATGIASIRFMDAATATASLPGLGSSIVAGAIVIHSRVGR